MDLAEQHLLMCCMQTLAHLVGVLAIYDLCVGFQGLPV